MSGTGEWTALRVLNPNDLSDFEAALKKHVGVKYAPLLVATQVVSGTNYCFICNGVTVTEEPAESAAVIHIWKKASGEFSPPEIKPLIS